MDESALDDFLSSELDDATGAGEESGPVYLAKEPNAKAPVKPSYPSINVKPAVPAATTLKPHPTVASSSHVVQPAKQNLASATSTNVIQQPIKPETKPVHPKASTQSAKVSYAQPAASSKISKSASIKSNQKSEQDSSVSPTRQCVSGKNTNKPRCKAELTRIHPVAKKWKDVFVRAGFKIEFAWKHGFALAKAGYDETNAGTLTDETLSKLGIEEAGDRAALFTTMSEIAEEMRIAEAETSASNVEQVHDDHATSRAFITWRNLLLRARLGKEWGASTTTRYALLLARAGFDETNVENMTEEDYEAAGITDQTHREVIMLLVERELAEAAVVQEPEEYLEGVRLDSSQKVSKEDVDEARQAMARVKDHLEAFDEFQRRLSEILGGNTESQREARAKREAATAQRRAEREQRRIARTVKRMGV